MKSKIICLMLASAFTLTLSNAQINNVYEDSLYSDVLGLQRHFQILLPENYDPNSEQKFSVLYFLDGNGNKNLIKACHEFIVAEGYMPNIILVAVYNVDRNKDFLPSNMENVPTSGGADKFLEFFKSELIPYINSKYPTNEENMLYGHSFGGVFSMYALLSEPQLFSAYIAVDPSFWWDNGFMQKLAGEKLSLLQNMNKVLFISGREGQAYSGMGIDKMDSVLESKAPESLDWKSVAYPDESHGSVRYKSIYDGLRYAYEGFRSQMQFHPQAGIMLEDKPIQILVISDNPNVRYTTDGTEPSGNSPLAEQVISMPAPGQLRVRSFSKRGQGTNEIIGEFASGEIIKSQKLPKKYEAGGLNYEYYEGSWDSLPDFNSINPVNVGFTSKEFTLNSLGRKENFGCVFEGMIEIKEKCYYIFGLDSDDGSRMFLGNRLILNNDGLHATGNAKSYILPLEVGFYPIKIEYFQKGGGAEITFVYLKEGVWQSQPFPIEQQYFRK